MINAGCYSYLTHLGEEQFKIWFNPSFLKQLRNVLLSVLSSAHLNNNKHLPSERLRPCLMTAEIKQVLAVDPGLLVSTVLQYFPIRFKVGRFCCHGSAKRVRVNPRFRLRDNSTHSNFSFIT